MIRESGKERIKEGVSERERERTRHREISDAGWKGILKVLNTPRSQALSP